MKIDKSIFLRILIAFLFVWSLASMYYSDVVLKDYEIITNPDGPDLEE